MSLSPSLLLQAFARAIASARTERGLTVDELAQRTGIAVTVVHAMEAGHHAPLLEEMVALAQALGCEAADLIERTMAGYRREE